MTNKNTKTSAPELNESSPPERRDQATALKADGAPAAENKATNNAMVTRSEELPSFEETVEMLKKDLSGYDADFSCAILLQLGALSLTKDPSGIGWLFARSVLKDVRPGDKMAMLLVVQMLAVHDGIMSHAILLAGSEHLEQRESFANIFNKLARTFAHQMDTLHRLRSGPEPKVTVNNVSVSDGGQAIVGPVTQNGGGTGGAAIAKPLLALTDQSGTDMPILQPEEQPAGTVPPIIEQDQEPGPSTKRRKRRG
jgi:hypothetical protein